jgi:hypothetical protein
MKPWKIIVLFAGIALFAASQPLRAENIVFPADAGVIDVTKAPYNARGDGKTDDTLAIQQALSQFPNANKIIYLPNGTYLISDTLKWPAGTSEGNSYKRTTLQGQSRAGTIVRLRDNAPDYNDFNKRKAMIYTGPHPAQRFGNEIRNLTVDSGSGNPGVAAVQFNTSNQGCVREVTIRSGDGKGLIGLDMSFVNEIGPLLIKNVSVSGFDIGIKTGGAVNSMTLEHITLENQNQFGFRNEGEIVNIRGLKSSNAVPAVSNGPGSSFITLLDSTLHGKGRAAHAIENEATFFARNVTTSGYAGALKNSDGKSVTGPKIEEFVSHPILSLFPSPARSLNLPIKETPEVPWDGLKDWASPTHFGVDLSNKDKKHDDTQAFQQAIDSGKTTVYLPNGTYKINGDVRVRGNVRRIIGCKATIEGEGAMIVDEGAAPVVVIERVNRGYGQAPITNASSRTLVLSSCLNVTAGDVKGKGDLFIEDVVSNPFTSWQFHGQNVWARQFNVENMGTHISNDGGTMWIFGLKTERGGVLVETKNNAKTEICGGFNYSTTGPKTTPMFTIENSSVSITLGETNFNRNPYISIVSETRGDQTKVLYKGDAPGRHNGTMLPLYVGYAAPQGAAGVPMTQPVVRTEPPLAMPAPQSVPRETPATP